MIISGSGTDILFQAILFLFGAVVGSFLNVVILRLPDDQRSIAYPPSHCPECKTPIRWYDNIPILSYILLKGRCRSCKTSISWQYPFVESAMGLLSVALLNRFGLSFDLFLYFVFVAALLAILFIDLHHQIIPDSISLPGILVGLGGSFFSSQLTWQEAILGALAGGGFLYAIAFGYLLLRKQEGMGGGDIKLLAMIGAFLGWKSLLYIIFASSVAGSLIGITILLIRKQDRQTRIPFGPFLAVAALSYLFFQEQIFAFWQAWLINQ